MIYRYLPMLKTKAGEVVALDNLTNAAKQRIFPVFHACGTISNRFATALSGAWSGRSVALDGSFSFRTHQTPTDFLNLIAQLRANGLTTMPSVSYSDPPAYVAAVRSVIDGNGLVVKTSLGGLGSVFGWIASQGWNALSIDLVIEANHLDSIDVQSYSGYVISLLHQAANSLQTPRSVTLSSAAAPKDHGGLAYGANRVPRADWQLWSLVAAASPVRLDYGDYCTGHPDLTEPPGAAMGSATVSARYSLPAEWLIIKGRATGGAYGLPMGTQYTSHARTIAADPSFGGLPACWADSQISLAAAGVPGIGSRQKWAEIAANRHMSLVADRLP